MTGRATIVDTVRPGRSVTDRIRAIVALYRRRHGAKRLADVARVSARTAQDWLQDRAVPSSAETLLRLMAEHPDLYDAINRDVVRLRDAAAVAVRIKARKQHEETVRVCPGVDRPSADRPGVQAERIGARLLVVGWRWRVEG